MKTKQRTFTCNDCRTSGSSRWMETHPCEHNQYVAESGGRCEDYPCCGHTDGDGCYALESHTSAFYLDHPELLHEPGSPEWYDAMEELHGGTGEEPDEVDPEDCHHEDTSQTLAGVWKCDWCHVELLGYLPQEEWFYS